jgi:hypothetical protein
MNTCSLKATEKKIDDGRFERIIIGSIKKFT